MENVQLECLIPGGSPSSDVVGTPNAMVTTVWSPNLGRIISPILKWLFGYIKKYSEYWENGGI
jgi:hypothetical protein